MSGKTALFGGAVASVLLACGPAAAEARARTRHPAKPSPMEQKVEALTASVRALEARLDEESKARQALQAQAQAATDAAAASRAEAQAARAELADQIKTIPGAVDTAVAAKTPASVLHPVQGGQDHSRRVPGGRGHLSPEERRLRHFVELRRIPFRNSPLSRAHELRGTARQTRLSLLVQGDVNPTTHAAFYGEFDFQGAAQTAQLEREQLVQPRIRHLYGTLDWDDLGLELSAGPGLVAGDPERQGHHAAQRGSAADHRRPVSAGLRLARQPQISRRQELEQVDLGRGVSVEIHRRPSPAQRPGYPVRLPASASCRSRQAVRASTPITTSR